VRFLVDVNLSPQLAVRLRDAGHDAVHASDLGLLTASDGAILDRGLTDGRVVVSADSDLVGLRSNRVQLSLFRRM